jgi:hypothetical protein
VAHTSPESTNSAKNRQKRQNAEFTESPRALGARGEDRAIKKEYETKTIKEIKEAIRNEPNDENGKFAGCFYPDEDDDSADEEYEDEEVLLATEEKKIKAAADSGSVVNVVGPGDVPETVKVVKRKGRSRNFTGAGGGRIKGYGTAQVELVQPNGKRMKSTTEVADVVRPLHSVGCITDNDHDMLFKKGCAYVVPEGVFDEVLKRVEHVATYPREEGGLYVTEVTVRDPKARKAAATGFGGPGQGR